MRPLYRAAAATLTVALLPGCQGAESLGGQEQPGRRRPSRTRLPTRAARIWRTLTRAAPSSRLRRAGAVPWDGPPWLQRLAAGRGPALPSASKDPPDEGRALSDFLQQACASARGRVAAARRVHSEPDLRAAAADLPDPPSFADALAAPGVAVIAEVKRASPSRGVMADIPDPAALALAYAGGGAAAVSVLTEPRWFRGTLDDLAAVSAAVALPVLRKDFVVEGYQVLEARLVGAAAVLLIVAALDDAALRDLLSLTHEVGLEALVEVHDVADAERAAGALDAAATGRQPVVGVNARDLTTLTVDPGRFAAVHAALPAGTLAVAESGVRTAADVARVVGLGADAVLIGEHVATASDPAAAVADLLAGDPSRTAPATVPPRSAV